MNEVRGVAGRVSRDNFLDWAEGDAPFPPQVSEGMECGLGCNAVISPDLLAIPPSPPGW